MFPHCWKESETSVTACALVNGPRVPWSGLNGMLAPPLGHRNGWPGAQIARGPPAEAGTARNRHPRTSRERDCNEILFMIFLQLSLVHTLADEGGEGGVGERSFRRRCHRFAGPADSLEE